MKGEVVSPGRRKYGVTSGDGAKTGIQTSLNAGVKLETEARTGISERIVRTDR